MRAKKETEFVVLKLMYLPRRGETYPPTVGIHQKLIVPPSIQFPIRKWFREVEVKERSLIPNGNRVTFRMREIISHDIELFTVYNIRFHKLLAIIGEEKIHWIFYIHKPGFARMDGGTLYRPVYACMDGVTALTLNYCRCCFVEQYMKFVESILNDQDPNCYLLS